MKIYCVILTNPDGSIAHTRTSTDPIPDEHIPVETVIATGEKVNHGIARAEFESDRFVKANEVIESLELRNNKISIKPEAAARKNIFRNIEKTL